MTVEEDTGAHALAATPLRKADGMPHLGLTPNRAQRARPNARRDADYACESATRGGSSATPHAIRSTHSQSTSNMVTQEAVIQKERKAEARLCVRDRLVENVPDILEAARPADSRRRAQAEAVSSAVQHGLERYIQKWAPVARPAAVREGPGPERAGRGLDRKLSTMSLAGQTTSGPATRARTQQAAHSRAQESKLVSWVCMGRAQFTVQSERQMYPGIGSFTKFVADKAAAAAESWSPSVGTGFGMRRIVAFEKSDVVAANADDRTRIDHMVTGGPHHHLDVPEHPDYADALAVIEAKFRPSEQKSAYEQLVMYSRNLYASQHHRRFVWRLTVCGTRVRACVLCNDRVFSSADMDVSRSDGRARFVRLLVDWALCESAQLGYDPGVAFNPETNRWDITVHSSAGMLAARTYSCSSTILIASSLLGRHTRCFVATRPAADGGGRVLIKDAWAHSSSGGGSGRSRDEAAYMRAIHERLGGDATLRDKYPVLEAGGVVQIDRVGDDTAAALMAWLGLGSDATPPRVHVRLAMSPVGDPLQHARSPDEVIVAVCDAMEAHTAILRRCGILHRDVSVGNILLRRGADGAIGGMLIDFDNAVWADEEGTVQRPDRTGTLPYMSIGNLACSSVRRTALDDWESLVYILCWLGTFGINKADEKKFVDTPVLEIKEWRTGSPEQIAGKKRLHMNSPENFAIAILSGFLKLDGYGHLLALAKALHQMMFCNPKVSPKSQRCWSMAEFDAQMPLQSSHQPDADLYDASIDAEITDPFARRAQIADSIVDDLLQTLQAARNAAQARIASAASQDENRA